MLVLGWQNVQALTVGGDLAATTDYIFRGISLSDGNGAAQVDVHGTTTDGTFAGAFASTLSQIDGHGARYEVEGFIGHRFHLSEAWSTSVTAAASPNTVRYAREYRLGRYPSYVTDAAVQWPIVGRLSVTGGIGYYSLTGPHGSAYWYGNAGIAYEYRSWRVDAGYYETETRSQYMFPYGEARNRFAATLSWRF